MTESKDDMSKVSANIASNKIDDRAFYREAVEKGAFTVSAGGAKRIDIVKLLRIEQVLALALVLQLLLLIGPFYMHWVVDHALVAAARDLITVLGVGFLLLALLQVGVTALRGWVLMVLGTSLNLQLVSNLFRHLIRRPMAWFEKRHIGDVASRFESMNVIQRTLTSSFLEAVIDGLMVIVSSR